MNTYAILFSEGFKDPARTVYVDADDDLTARLILFRQYPKARIMVSTSVIKSAIAPKVVESAEVIYVDFKARRVIERKVS